MPLLERTEMIRFCTRSRHCPALQCAAQTRISDQGPRARATHRAASATPPPNAGSGASSGSFRAHGEGLDPHMWRMTYMSMYANDNQDTACWSTCLQMNRWAQHRASPDRSARRQTSASYTRPSVQWSQNDQQRKRKDTKQTTHKYSTKQTLATRLVLYALRLKQAHQ
jgi:hypothetical protein